MVAEILLLLHDTGWRNMTHSETQKNVVSFATDSIITTEKLDVNSSELGGFALENTANDVYVLQNGIYRFNKSSKNTSTFFTCFQPFFRTLFEPCQSHRRKRPMGAAEKALAENQSTMIP